MEHEVFVSLSTRSGSDLR